MLKLGLGDRKAADHAVAWQLNQRRTALHYDARGCHVLHHIELFGVVKVTRTSAKPDYYRIFRYRRIKHATLVIAPIAMTYNGFSGEYCLALVERSVLPGR